MLAFPIVKKKMTMSDISNVAFKPSFAFIAGKLTNKQTIFVCFSLVELKSCLLRTYFQITPCCISGVERLYICGSEVEDVLSSTSSSPPTCFAQCQPMVVEIPSIDRQVLRRLLPAAKIIIICGRIICSWRRMIGGMQTTIQVMQNKIRRTMGRLQRPQNHNSSSRPRVIVVVHRISRTTISPHTMKRNCDKPFEKSRAMTRSIERKKHDLCR